MKHPGKIKKFNRGFTLTELIIVLSLLAIVGLIAFPSYQRMAVNGNLRTAARQLASDFFNLRQSSLTENRMYRIPLDVAGNNYTLQQCNNTGSVCGGYTNILAKNLAAVAGDITFDAGGTTVVDFFLQPRGAVTAGTVVLQNSRGSTATINVNATGRTHVQFNLQ
ncbi:MAG: type II secretion system protein [Syntrophaceae bacterium]|nr:type II secretion system protein [Syntrophaceae bacterium]